MNQEQVTAENTEEKAAEVTASSEMAGQTQEAVRPKGKWFGRGIYGSRCIPLKNHLRSTELPVHQHEHAVCDQGTYHSGCLCDRYEKVSGKKVMT